MFKSIFPVLLIALSAFPSIAAAQQTIDVYIIAGQSNTDGRGPVSSLSEAQIASLQSDTIISYVNPGSERERANPTSTPPDLDAGTSGFTALVAGGFSVSSTSNRMLSQTFGPELSFGASIAAATGSSNQIAIIKVSRGGTNLRNDWLFNTNVDTGPDEPEGFLYRALIERVTNALAELEVDGNTAIVRGFVWHQGESDSTTVNVNAYASRFAQLVTGVRAEFGADIPFVLGELSQTRDNSVEFNDNLPNVVNAAPGISFISSEGLTTLPGDTTHFDANGQLELGQRFAAAFGAGEIEPLPEPEPSILFDFRNDGAGVIGADPNGSDFDPSVAGDTITIDGLTTTIVDITAPEYDTTGDLPVLTDNILSSANGDGGGTSVGGQGALGINNPSINNSTFDMIGDGSEGNDINPGETITLTFDQPVRFTSIDLESVSAQDSFTVLVDGAPALESIGVEGPLDLGDLAEITIAVGSEVTFAVDGVLETATQGPSTSVRIETFAVQIVTAPEPPLLGDVNLDMTVNFSDISPFIGVLSSSGFQAEADINQDNVVSFTDISPFIAILSAQ